MTRREQTAFTLIEILIVAALIALLAGIAVINIQAAFLSNQRKATYGEVRSIATALEFAFEDIQVYPKLCFLGQNTLFLAPPKAPNLSQPGDRLVSGFDVMGYDCNPPYVAATVTARIIKNWGHGNPISTGYFSAGQGRRGLFAGRPRSGMCRMELPTDIYTEYTPAVIGTGLSAPVYDWPTDPWGSPYVVYLLWIEGVKSDGTPNVHFVDSLTREPNYVRAVVSYGPNGFPGGSENFTGTEMLTQGGLRLYTKSATGQADFRWLRPGEMHQALCDIWSSTLASTPVPGITDKGSDDIVLEF